MERCKNLKFVKHLTNLALYIWKRSVYIQLWSGVFGALSVCCSFSVSADLYAGMLLSYSNAEYKHDELYTLVEENPFLLQSQIGYFFNDYFALEARYGVSLQRDNTLAINSLASGYIKLNVPISPRTAFYGLGGYSGVEINQKSIGSDKDQSISFGLGLHYALDKHNAIVFEFVNNSSEDRTRLNTLTFGLQHRF